MDFYRNLQALFILDIENEKISPGMIDDVMSIRLGPSTVEFALMGMAFHILAGGNTGIQVPNAFMIRDEINTIANPQRCRQVSSCRLQDESPTARASRRRYVRPR